jgi:hypothetical protein
MITESNRLTENPQSVTVHHGYRRTTYSRAIFSARSSGTSDNMTVNWNVCAGRAASAVGSEMAKAQDLQRIMFGEAIGRPLAITVMRNGALVDVIAEPTELVAA